MQLTILLSEHVECVRAAHAHTPNPLVSSGLPPLQVFDPALKLLVKTRDVRD